MSATGASNPEYVNARVRARKAALFDEEDYRKLVRMGPSGIARYMEESEYETEINALGARHSGVDLIEHALHRNMAKHFRDLLSWSNGKLHEQIARYLRKYDAWNLKTVIRGIYTDSSFQEFESDLVLAGEIDRSTLEQMASMDTIREAITILDGTIYAEPLEEAVATYESDIGVLVPIENAIDRAFYTRLVSHIGEEAPREGPLAMYVEFLQAEIDFLNVRNALRLAYSGAEIEPDEYFIEGGLLFTRGEIQGLIAAPDDLIAVIRESTYGDELDEALTALADADSLIQFEHALDAVLLSYTGRLANVHPVSVTSIFSYILAKEREIENIRAIARGKEAGLDETAIERELVMI